MSVRAKIILSVLIAILLGGAGYFFIINQPKPKVLPPINTVSKTEEIDTSNWQTYRNEKLGFEIKMPKEWSGGYYLGRFIPDDPEFWQEQVGGASFNGSFRVSSSPQFTVRVKDSDLSLEEFLGSSWEEYFVINGLPAKRHKIDQTNLGKVRFGEFVVIKNEKRYYYISFSSGFDSSEMIEKTKIVWETILMTFKPVYK